MAPTIDFLARQAAAYRALSGKYMLLTNNSTGYTIASNKALVLAQEVPELYGYSRQPYSPASNSYDAGQVREEIELFEAEFTATGGSIQYDRAVIISQAASSVAGVLTSGIDSGTNRLSFSASNIFTAGTVTECTITPEAGATVPAELLSSGSPRLLHIINPVNSGTFSAQFALTPGGSAIDFSGGSGTLRVRNCSGDLDFIEIYGDSLITDGASQTIKIGLACGGNDANVNAA